jgi:hypothetical protein
VRPPGLKARRACRDVCADGAPACQLANSKEAQRLRGHAHRTLACRHRGAPHPARPAFPGRRLRGDPIPAKYTVREPGWHESIDTEVHVMLAGEATRGARQGMQEGAGCMQRVCVCEGGRVCILWDVGQ